MQVERNKPEVKMDPNKFDTITHHWDAGGKLLRTNCYTLHVIEGNQYFERPVNSGNIFFGNNQPAGRIERKPDSKGHVVKQLVLNVPHQEYKPKLEGDDQLMKDLQAAQEQNMQLARELAAIKKER